MCVRREVWTRDAYLRTAVNFAAAVTDEVREQQDAVFAAKAQLERTLQREKDEFHTRLRRRRACRDATVTQSHSPRADPRRTAETALCLNVEEQLFEEDLDKQRRETETRLRTSYPLAYLDDATENALSAYNLLPVLQRQLAHLVRARTMATAPHENVDDDSTRCHGDDDGGTAVVLKRVKLESGSHTGNTSIPSCDVEDSANHKYNMKTKTCGWDDETGAYMVPRAGRDVVRQKRVPGPHPVCVDAGVTVPAWLAAAVRVPSALDFVRVAWERENRRRRELLRWRVTYLREERAAAQAAGNAARATELQRALDAVTVEEEGAMREVAARRTALLARLQHRDADLGVEGAAQTSSATTPVQAAIVETVTSSSSTTTTVPSSAPPPRHTPHGDIHVLYLAREDEADAQATSSDGIPLSWYRHQVARYRWPLELERGIGHSVHGCVRPTPQGCRVAQGDEEGGVTVALPRVAAGVFVYLEGRGDFLCSAAALSKVREEDDVVPPRPARSGR